MGTTGLPYWTAADRLLQFAMAIMYDVQNRNTHLHWLFRDDTPLQHRVITGYLCSEENVDDSTSLDYVVVVDIVDDTPSESSTAPSCRTFVFYAVPTYKKALSANTLQCTFYSPLARSII